MRWFPAKKAGSWVLVAWTALVTAGLWLAGEPCLRWALQNGAWEAKSPGTSEDPPDRGEQPAEAAAEEFWSVPLAGSAEAWQKWSKKRWQQWQQLGPEAQVQQVTALLELLESPGVQLVPAARKQVAWLLEQIYNQLAQRKSVAGWPLLAKVQQRRIALLDQGVPAGASQATATVSGKQGSAPEGAEPLRSGSIAFSAREKTPAADGRSFPASVPFRRDVPSGGESSRAEDPGRLPRAVANQARRLGSSPPPVAGAEVPGPSAPPLSEAAAGASAGKEAEGGVRPGGGVRLREPVGRRPPAEAPLWQLWHRWHQAADPQRKRQLWTAIASARVPQEVKQTLRELGSPLPGRQAKALERLSAQLGPGASAWLWWAAESPHEQVRLTALSLLASGSDPLQLRRVYRAARGDESPRVRRLARQIESRLR